MIDALLPSTVTVVESREDPLDVRLFPAEAATIATSVEKRRREFTTGRFCAHAALAQLGQPPTPVLSGPRGEPRWPSGVVGSITHCVGYRACAVASSRDVASIGIDAEPNAALREGLLGDIAGPAELRWLRQLRRDAPGVHWDRLLFSAKETVYKVWFPLAEAWLGFEDARVTFDLAAATFTAHLLVPGPHVADGPLETVNGRWAARDGLLLTAATVPAVPRAITARVARLSSTDTQREDAVMTQ